MAELAHDWRWLAGIPGGKPMGTYCARCGVNREDIDLPEMRAFLDNLNGGTTS